MVTVETDEEPVLSAFLGGGIVGGKTNFAALDGSGFVFGIDVALAEDREERLPSLSEP
jgi:hypothetical protein